MFGGYNPGPGFTEVSNICEFRTDAGSHPAWTPGLPDDG
jgi:hypothetical protein